MSETTTFDQHCIVELFGHTRIAGRVTEQTIGGKAFLRVDVPDTPQNTGFTRYYGPDAVYAMTPVDEKTCLVAAVTFNTPHPVKTWEIEEHLHLLAAPDPDDEVLDSADFLPDDEPLPEVDLDDLPDDTPDIAGDTETDRERAIKTAWTWLKKPFVILDLETTGLKGTAEIVQIGVIDQDGAVVLEQLVKPSKAIRNSRLHGITDAMVQEAPAFPDVYPQVKAALEGKTVLAYNYEFDRTMLDQVCQRHGLDLIDIAHGYCVMELYAQYNGDWNDYHGNYRWGSLSDAVKACGLTFDGQAHSAVADTQATLAVLKHMADGYVPF